MKNTGQVSRLEKETLSRYQNVKGSIETQQNLIRQRAGKYPQEWLHTSTMSTSRHNGYSGAQKQL